MRLPRKMFPERKPYASKARCVCFVSVIFIEIKFYKIFSNELIYLYDYELIYIYMFGKELISCYLNIALLIPWTDKWRMLCVYHLVKEKKRSLG